MKARLLFADQDFDWLGETPWNTEALRTDLALDTLFRTMADEDETVLAISEKVILRAMENDVATIEHRQAILEDCLSNPAVVRELYAMAVEVAEARRSRYLGRTLGKYPEWVLSYSVDHMELLFEQLKRLRRIADREARHFKSPGWDKLFAGWRLELSDEFFRDGGARVEQLKRFNGMVMSAELGPANIARDYVLHRPLHGLEPTWWQRLKTWLFPANVPPHSFDIHPLDESGTRALNEIRAHGLAVAARSLAAASDHVFGFFKELRDELAFYIGCLNLRDRLNAHGEAVCIPRVTPSETEALGFSGLFDVTLALTIADRVVPNDVDADGRSLVIVTGANQGGKTTFLRSLGLAQLMTQAGMFAPAASFRTSQRDGLFTHYKREEDTALEAGKFDEELGRMSEIVDHLTARPLILFNESFAATNEREGAEIAWQILSVLQAHGVRIVCVTYLYELARRFLDARSPATLFLRAERQEGGARTFRIIEGDPLRTSFGEDLYSQVFGEARPVPKACSAEPTPAAERLGQVEAHRQG